MQEKPIFGFIKVHFDKLLGEVEVKTSPISWDGIQKTQCIQKLQRNP